MTEPRAARPCPTTEAAVLALMMLTGVMLLALFTRTAPHPPLAVPPFALGPFLGASLAIGAAALRLGASNPAAARALALLFAVTALISFGPQKYFDPALPLIWPAVVAAQAGIAVIVVQSALAWRRPSVGRPDDRRSRTAPPRSS